MSSSSDTHKRIQTLKMPHREASCYKPRKDHKDMPSFSSTLLDEIYRSFDGSDGKAGEDFDFNHEKSVKKIEDQEDFRRACLVENWMRKEESRKVSSKVRPPLMFPEMEAKPFQDNDLFFSSTSSSSDSSGALSSSDTEFFGPTTTKTAKVSCFAARPKPVRTGKNYVKDGSFFDDYANHDKERKLEDELMKSKSRALKIYANLKKMKQPISPGGKLTTFINSLFVNNANGKKPKNADSDKVFRDSKSSSKASSSSNCSSTSSFSRSCLSKYSPKSREKMREGVPRTVRFHPVSVIVDQDSRPCGHKSIYDDGRPPLPPISLSKSDKNRKLEEASLNALRSYYSKKCDDDLKKILREDDDFDIDDGASDASSDLFELDHLSLFRDSRFGQELPVYETTHFDKNRSLIC